MEPNDMRPPTINREAHIISRSQASWGVGQALSPQRACAPPPGSANAGAVIASYWSWTPTPQRAA